MAELSDIVKSLLADPESLAGIKRAAEAWGAQAPKEAETPAPSPLDAVLQNSPLLRRALSQQGERSALLRAIRPYLCAARQARLDAVLAMLSIGEKLL